MAKNKPPKPKNQKLKSHGLDKLPVYCDYTCSHASFPPADAAGACRREIAVWCTLKKKFNNKNARCLVRV